MKMNAMKIGKLMNRDKTLGLLLAAACLAGGFEKTTAQVVTIRDPNTGDFVDVEKTEPLEIHYTNKNREGGFREVNPGHAWQFVDSSYYSVNLPAGMRHLEGLNVRDSSSFNLTTLKLPKDIGIDASIPFRLKTEDYLPILQLHKDMRAFYLFRGQNVLRIPPMQDLIQNLEPDDDGLIRTVFHGVSIEVYGVPPRLTMKRRSDGVELSWKGGVLQSAPSIDGPWTDITYGAPRWLFLKSFQPAEFFRVKPD